MAIVFAERSFIHTFCGRERRRTWPLTIVLVPFLFSGAALADERALKMKSAFIYYVSKLVTFKSRKGGEELRLCVVGNGSLAATLSDSLSGRSIQGAAARIIELPSENLAEGKFSSCHLTYLESSKFLDAASSARLGLTLAEDPGFLKAGGILELYEENNKFRFRVNIKAAHRASIDLPSDLLALATEVVNR